MSRWPVMVLATLLLLAGLLAARLGPRSKGRSIALGVLVLGFVLLAAMFLAADAFTGRGIDQSVLYHVQYGLTGAGFSEYSGLILGTIALVLIGVATGVGCSLLLQRGRPGATRPRASRASVPLALLACALNPASKDLLELGGAGSWANLHSEDDKTASFKAHYRAPTLGPNPNPRRNFIFIYAEGLERTYLDEGRFPGLMTGLRELEAIGTTFTDIDQTSGTSFTIGGIVGSQCGIPLFTSSGGNSMGGMSEFLPNAVCLGDLLKARGYHLSYLGGASLKFAGKGKFLSGHGFREVQGREQLTARLPDPSYTSGWGLHDDSLLDMAYEKFVDLSSRPQPFGLFLLTLDTHHPNGHVSKAVANVRYENGDVAILNAVAGSDKLLAAFVKRVLESPAGSETVIVLCSDHLAMKNGASERLSQGERRMLFLIVDPLKPGASRIDKPGVTLDIGPTVLHALGYKASLGLGRDLLSDEISLRQELPDLRASLSHWREPLSGFWGLSRLDGLRINAAERTIEAGGTTVLAPALITFDDSMAAEVFFEFFTRQTKLQDYLYRLPAGKPFVLTVDCERAGSYTDIEGASGGDLCVVAGRRGAEPVVRQRVDELMELDDDQLEAVLETQATPELHLRQTARLREAQLPKGLLSLVGSLPPGTVFYHGAANRVASYIKEYAAQPEVAARGLVWTKSLPQDVDFYFGAADLKTVQKTRQYKLEQLHLDIDIVQLLESHARDVVVLSLKGDIKAMSKRTVDYLRGRGLELSGAGKAPSFAAVLDNAKVVAAGVNERARVVLASDALQALGIERVESAGRRAGNLSKVIVRGKDVSKNARGLNIVVLTRSGTRKSYAIDTHVTELVASELYKATPKQ